MISMTIGGHEVRVERKKRTESPLFQNLLGIGLALVLVLVVTDFTGKAFGPIAELVLDKRFLAARLWKSAIKACFPCISSVEFFFVLIISTMSSSGMWGISCRR